MKHVLVIFFLAAIYLPGASQEMAPAENNNDVPVRSYELSITNELVNKTGEREVMGMKINGSIPGPTLTFIEGEYAVIHVTNHMNVETSVHWHGLLLPNFQDGVPYLTTPPIAPGTSFTYEFPIKQSGTYWYHSHTMLQEQSGVYGSIVIEPKTKSLDYESDLVLVLSDWTDEEPSNVLRNLKRGNEWYNIKKGTSTPLNQVIARGALRAQFNFWKQRMESADIADVYYPAFLTNGEKTIEYPDLQSGEKIRVRFVNAAASTYFWLTFGGNDPMLVSSDGIDVMPIARNKTLIAVAETYDFILTIPDEGSIEIRASAQDGSGATNAILGKGSVKSAPTVPAPNKIEMMQKMAKMKMKMGAPALKRHPEKDERDTMKATYGMQMNMNMDTMDVDTMDHKMHMNAEMNEEKEAASDMSDHEESPEKGMKHDHHRMQMGHKKANESMGTMGDSSGHTNMETAMSMFAEFNYNYLKSTESSELPSELPVDEILLNLTGNMNRYIWSMNGVPLNETDKIKIEKDHVTRLKLNNLTMMHHPMHLHGHFFRVVNENGEYSPIKHTVNVAPMQEVTIEFLGNATGDWFFHCHILYHMMGGMARFMSYDTPRDPRMQKYPISKITEEPNMQFNWGQFDIASHQLTLGLTSSNIRNQYNFDLELGYNKNLESELTYQRYLYDYASVFGGINVENKHDNSLADYEVTAVIGMRFLTSYLFDLDVRTDHKLRPRFSLSREIMLFPKLFGSGYFEYQADFGIISNLENNKNFQGEVVWNAGLAYMLSKELDFFANYDNRFGAGIGLSLRL